MIVAVLAISCLGVLSFRSLSGIRYLALAVLGLFIVLAAAFYLAGPGIAMLRQSAGAFAIYARELIDYSTWLDPNEDGIWQNVWTTSYWSWWIVWSPFFGLFLARISAGRKLRSVLLTTVLLPPLLDVLWIGGSGGWSLLVESGAVGSELPDPLQVLKVDPAAALFLPGAWPAPSELKTVMQVLLLLLAGGLLALSLTAATAILPELASHQENGRQALRQRLVMLSAVALLLLWLDFYNTVIEALQVLALPLLALLCCHGLASLYRLVFRGPADSEDAAEEALRTIEEVEKRFQLPKLRAERKSRERKASQRIEPQL